MPSLSSTSLEENWMVGLIKIPISTSHFGEYVLMKLFLLLKQLWANNSLLEG